ncbi:MAG: SDR family NAD(P)-dependent oxidoreductase, partial [Myxococcota bacterium]|nr:SDR family NAD(P)-dependent oxidoreductase [Myxococcota bacterium]
SEVVVADLSDTDDPTGWLREAEARLGPTDILVNNAGVSFVEPVHGIDAERMAWKFQINLHTPIAAMHHVMEHMLERGEGTIVNIGSVSSFAPRPYFCHYTATKGALANFSEALRMELKSKGVHVLTVYPGPVSTPMGERNFDQFEDPGAARKAPTGDTGTLARLVLEAIDRKRARVIYPGFYKLGWWFPTLNRYLSEYLTPTISGRKTPMMSDLEDT